MTKSTLLIFLDIDGVLRVDGVQRYRELCSASVGRLRWLVRSTQAQVVISSSWRHASSLEFFQKVLGDFVIDVTPDIAFQQKGSREEEINKWLAVNRPGADWIALDDQSDLFYPSSRNLFLCDSSCGFDLEAFNRLLTLISERHLQ